jgi:PspAA-like protein
MIVRVLGEGQYDVSDEAIDRLNELDAAVEAAVEAGDEAAFGTALSALLEGVRTVGVPHDVESLDESDLILPPADATIDEVRALLVESDEGLIPG